MRTELKTYPQIYNKKPAKILFSGQRLYSLNLLKTLPDGTTEKVPAYFTMLKDSSDLDMLCRIEDLWAEKTKLGQRIISQFKENYKHRNIGFDLNYFAIECPQFNNIYERLRSISEVINENDFYTMNYLQSASQIKTIEELNGGGISLLRGLFAHSRDKKISFVEWIASNVAAPWYDKLGIKRRYDSRIPIFEIPKSDYNIFINKFEPQYGKVTEVINEN